MQQLAVVRFASAVLDPANPAGIHKQEFKAPAYALTRSPDGTVTIATLGGSRVLVSGLGYWAVEAPAEVSTVAPLPTKPSQPAKPAKAVARG